MNRMVTGILFRSTLILSYGDIMTVERFYTITFIIVLVVLFIILLFFATDGFQPLHEGML